LDADSIAKVIEYIDDKYYNQGEPLVSDDLYDVIREHLKTLNAKHPLVLKIGAAIALNDNRKEKLPYYMGSMDKIKSDNTALDTFRNKFFGGYIFADKLDGNSALLYCKGGKKQLFSRGNGIEGQNISHLIDVIQGIPDLDALMKSHNEVTIRGELIINKEDFDNVKDQGANARNMVAGLVNAKRPNPGLVKYVQFVAYTLITPIMKPSEQYMWLYKHAFRNVHNLCINSDKCSFQQMSEFLMERRNKSPYEIDGIIVTHDDVYKVEVGKNPSYAFAFKNIITQDTAEVVVTNVEWNISKDGYIKPVVEFSPVRLAGVVIKRATGFHGQYIYSNKIGPGARVIITRSGDVIPYIVKILKPADSGSALMPEVPYEWNDTCKELIVQGANEEVDFKQVENFFTKIKIRGMSSATIRKFYDNGLDTPAKVLNAAQSVLSEIVGDKVGAKIAQGIAEVKKDLDCVALMDASNMFGRGFGEKRLKVIVDAFPKIAVDKKFVPSKEDLLDVPGISDITAEKFIFGLQRYRLFISDSKIECSYSKDQEKQAKRVGDKMKGQVVLFTGFRDKDLSKIVVEQGGDIVESFTKKVTLVVAKDITQESGKVKQAKAANIRVMTTDQFRKTLLS
jgi:NAD-dependent DNA ligase